MARPILYIGNKNYSSWSLRSWLVLRWAPLEFAEVVIPLAGDATGVATLPAVLAVSPSGRVPALHIDDTVVWDSLAIAEWAAEQCPRVYPEDPLECAVCRSAVAEMHSGFAALRRDLSLNIRRRVAAQAWQPDVTADIERITALWAQIRARFGSGGPFLFGRRTVADAFFTPVASRFRTYSVPVPEVAQRYCDALLTDPDFLEWESAAVAEPWTIPQTDALYA